MDDEPGKNWRAKLAAALRGRVAILCVGNAMCADDGAGPALAERLQVDEPWRVFDCGVAPENWIGPVCKFRPDVAVVVDAIHFDAPPGAIGCWARDELAHGGMSTHRASLSMTLQIIEHETGAASLVLGIQPQSAQLGQGMSEAIGAAVDELAAELERLHGEARRPSSP